jgi:hypothetical protein
MTARLSHGEGLDPVGYVNGDGPHAFVSIEYADSNSSGVAPRAGGEADWTVCEGPAAGNAGRVRDPHGATTFGVCRRCRVVSRRYRLASSLSSWGMVT